MDRFERVVMRLLRYVLFCVFFAIGTASIVMSIMAEEIRALHSNKTLVASIRKDNDKIISLTEKYDSQIRLIRKDPNILYRLNRVTLGMAHEDDETAIPTVSEQQLANASRALLEKLRPRPENSATAPVWLQRCCLPKSRMILFSAGSALILIAFVFFSSPSKLKG